MTEAMLVSVHSSLVKSTHSSQDCSDETHRAQTRPLFEHMDLAGADTAQADIEGMVAYESPELTPTEVAVYVDTVEEPYGSLRESCRSYTHLLATGTGCSLALSPAAVLVEEMAGSSEVAIPVWIS